MMIVGYAYQQGLMPVSEEAIHRAIELNGVAVEFNKQAFLWGRRAAYDMESVEKLLGGAPQKSVPFGLDSFIQRRIADLTAYQNTAYADRFVKRVNRIVACEKNQMPGETRLSEAVAKGLYKLMAYKDEYEVARLYTDGAFGEAIRNTFEDGGTIKLHLAPPLIAEKDPNTGHLKKRMYGPWMLKAFAVLKNFKGLRGTAFDPFGYTEERKMERAVISEYEELLSEIESSLNADNYDLAVQLAALPMKMRGFGHVKDANVKKAKAEWQNLLAAFRDPGHTSIAAE
jgi:indolepyruvate ferredoxin oxidoreductase